MAFENRYSTLDRALHRVAFLTWSAQIALSDIEDQLFKKRLAKIEVKKPVFIAALPRAGTTLLLEIFAALDEFASHSYQNMPFVLIPMFWDRFTTAFRHSDVPRERAHGDGMLVSVNSPEAFEEVVWKAFWPQHYRADYIVPWSNENNPEFSDFLSNHMRKIIALRCNGSAIPVAPRYISKNNLNIARLGVIQRNFLDAVVLIPFRHPLQHASSLLHQHLNFLEIHGRDPFARSYMAAIGHYDFGNNLRPIDFGGWFTSTQSLDPTSISFWIKYWTAAYEHLLKQGNDHVRFLSYEALCKSPMQGLERLADFIEIKECDAFLGQGSRISTVESHSVDTSGISSADLHQAEAIYANLKKASLI
jgi:hypothetical protein